MAYLALLPKNTTFFGDDLDAESDDECNDDGLLEPELDKSANRNTSISNGIKFRIQVYLSDILIQYTKAKQSLDLMAYLALLPKNTTSNLLLS